jgi:poly(beta-D-mannuronate) lyase
MHAAPIRLALLLWFAATTGAGAQAMRPPFETRQPDPRAAARPCPTTAEPVAAFDLPSKYGQGGRGKRDTLDEDAEAAFEAAMAPIKAFTQAVAKSANDYQRSGRASAAECALAHLARWAGSDALRAPESHTAWYKLATTVAGLSASLMQIDPAIRDRPERDTAARWLQARGQAVRGYFDGLRTPRSSRNNHRAWAGLAAASAGAAAGDRALLDWGVASYRLVICQATREGALPLEIERGSKAREYHLYALAALTPLAALAERNGIPAVNACDNALDRVAAYTLAALADPTDIERRAGARQAGRDKPPSASKLVFLEPWLKRHPDKAESVAAYLKQRPLTLTDLGGDQTLLYAK